MKIAAARRMAWGLLAFGVVLAGAGLVLSVLNGERSGLLSITLFTLTFLGFGLTGSLVASRRPDNSIRLAPPGDGARPRNTWAVNPVRDVRGADRSGCAPRRGVGRVGHQLVSSWRVIRMW
jgi:hypothetical protein